MLRTIWRGFIDRLFVSGVFLIVAVFSLFSPVRSFRAVTKALHNPDTLRMMKETGILRDEDGI